MKNENSLYRRWGKRFFDLVLASMMLMFFSPIMAVIALLIRVKMGKPILFRQERPGLHEKPFTIYKFRTMTEEKDLKGNLIPSSERLTNFGKIIRSLSLDELPELWNVLQGDMSIIGPRPLLLEYLPHYSERQALRHNVLPGISGWAQINGRNVLSWKDRFELDLWYVENVSFWLDVKIILVTIKSVFFRIGITPPNSEVMTRFDSIKKGNIDIKDNYIE